jgi:glycosyltransferase involved in cell wall biosynthesis
MRKILLPTIDYPPARGGVARYIGAILKTYPDQVALLPLKKWQWKKIGNLVIFLAWRVRGYDAIWVHQVLPVGTAAMIVMKITKKPYVVFLHGLDFDLARRSSWKRALTRRVLSSADRIVTNSQALATEVRAFVDLSREPLVIYPTVSDELITVSKLPRTTSEKINLQKLGELALGVSRAATPLFVSTKTLTKGEGSTGRGTGLHLLTVARLVERKGHLKVLDALAKVPNATYHIVGDGPMLGAIQAKVNELGLGDRVTITTNAGDEQLPDIYRAADVFVMPTTKTEHDREGFGIVYLEAQLFGVPVIATRHPGVDEAVHDGEGGILVSDSPQELLAALERLKDQTTRSKFGARGRASVTHYFTREQQMYKLLELL